MNHSIRRKLTMATRVRDFNRAHPDASEGYTATLTRLEDRLARAEALATQERSGFLAVRAATTRKKELRLTIRGEHLEHLARIGRAVAADEPELARRFQLPRWSTNHQTFLAAARAMAAEAKARRAIFIRDGLPESFEEDLSKALTEYEDAGNEANAGTALHIGARADLKAVTTEIMQIVRRLDGINRYRFRSDPELEAAWRAARDVSWPTMHERTALPDDSTPAGPARPAEATKPAA